jgi:hypothetical protein
MATPPFGLGLLRFWFPSLLRRGQSGAKHAVNPSLHFHPGRKAQRLDPAVDIIVHHDWPAHSIPPFLVYKQKARTWLVRPNAGFSRARLDWGRAFPSAFFLMRLAAAL